MFGSLVVLLPFGHEGGNLLLSHRGRKYDFNGPALLKGAPPASAAYIAFFSDVEHEVVPVTSGYRVTITYNLYFDPSKGVPITYAPSQAQLEHPFKTALRTCLENADTEHVPPYLGFGLEHAYPFKSALLDPKSVNLKGADTALVKTLNELNIDHSFSLLYRESKDPDRSFRFRILSRVILDGFVETGSYQETVFEAIAGKKGSYLVWDDTPGSPEASTWYDEYYQDMKGGSQWMRFDSVDVKWVTEPREEYLDRSTIIAYGNESTLDYYYHQLCVVTGVPSVSGSFAGSQQWRRSD